LLGCAGGKTTTGAAGTSGAGTAGTTATTGAAGTIGAAGASAAAGTTGAAGTASVAGTTGAAGSTASAGTSGAAGSTGAAGTTGAGGSVTPTDGGTDVVCQMASYKFEPKLPTVYMLIDRSGTMFDCLSTTNTVEPSCTTPADTSWVKLKEAVLTVVRALEGQVRIGFASFSGTAGASGMCPVVDKVAPKLMNLAAITPVYNALPFPPNDSGQGRKFESPAPQALTMIGAELMADPSPGSKYILFVTDGELDYCDDGLPHCASDDVIGQLQRLNTAGIPTIVMGLQTQSFNLPAGTLQAFANAGAGEPTVIQPPAGGNATTIFDQCQPKALWRQSFLAGAPECAADLNACRGRTIGTYMPTAGPTKPYTPNATDQTMLVNQLSAAISGVKSCVFDLGDVGGKAIKVDLTKLAQAKVTVEDAVVPLSDTDGWKMNSQTQLELVGAACTNWRMPNVDDIDFQFPCSTIIFE
jgi:hypothetical protein